MQSAYPAAESAADLDRLRAVLVSTRRQRMDAERDVQRRVQLEAALVVAERDADAITTTDLAAHRRINEVMAAELSECWAHINRNRVLAAILDAAAMKLDGRTGLHAGPRLLQAFEREEEHRSDVRALLAETGVLLLVPELAPLTVEPHPNADRLADLFDQATDDARARDAARRHGHRGRRDDYGPR